jgi:hypothetical protein
MSVSFSLLLLMAPAVLALGCGHDSLADVVRARRDEFPRSSLVLVPPASLSRLGETVELLGDGRARPTGTKCFHVAPTVGAGLRELRVEYQESAGMLADLSRISSAVAAALKVARRGSLVLTGLHVEEGLGVPIVGSACDFKVDGTTEVSVLTALVVAEKAEFQSESDLGLTGKLEAGWSAERIVAAGTSGNRTVLRGSNLVITGSATRVRTTILTVSRDLGSTPRPGTVVEFPAGWDGSVAVVGFRSVPSAVLSLRVNTTMNAQVRDAPSHLSTCPVGKEVDLNPGESCFVWNGSGASGTNLSYAISPEGRIILKATGHRSAFVSDPAKPN